jgi:ATP-dependent DNA helicase RecG
MASRAYFSPYLLICLFADFLFPRLPLDTDRWTLDTKSMILPSTRIDKVPGIGPATAEKLLAVGLNDVLDLLHLLPRAWEDLSHLSRLVDMVPNGQKFTIKARLSNVKMFRAGARRMMLTQATATDETGSLPVIWFNQPYLAKNISGDGEYYLSGLLTQGKRGLVITNPSVETASHAPVHSGRIIPVYSTVGGVSTKMLRRIFSRLLPTLGPIPDILPQSLLDSRELISLDSALRELHQPTSLVNLEIAKSRLAFDELLGVQLQVQANKLAITKYKAKPIPTDIDFIKNLIGKLPYELTPGQKRALWDTLQDLADGKPTNRMIEGDVGSGKTIVAALAMLNAAKYGYQSALMAPTEVLATQHFQNLQSLVEDAGYTISLQTQSQTVGELSSDIIIGTHKLIQKGVSIPHLNLVIVDEQHRFGVKQREALKQIGAIHDEVFPHFVSLTATPIPRSLALTLFGDLDLSIIPNRPNNRASITTTVASNTNRAAINKTIVSQLVAGHQVFVVTPLIETSLKLTAKSAENEAEVLRKTFPQYSVGILHGKMTGEQKQLVMEEFKANRIQILVATTVIEVGIDIANATVMLIEGAERFGLSQLHQLRGRVGRSSFASFCFVIPTTDDPDIVERLNLFAKTTDGFKLAELDLELRGPGSLLGTSQAGFVKFRLADWTNPAKIEAAQQASRELLSESPDLSLYPELLKRFNMADINFHSE